MLIIFIKYNFFKISKFFYNHIGQRIDNFLFCILKNIKRSYIYKILRLGIIRINKKRIKYFYKLKKSDIIKIPFTKNNKKKYNKIFKIKLKILFEDKYLLIINKKSGTAVHSGSGINFGIIESIKNNSNNYYELVHRLDKDTSGILLIAKKRSCLKFLHEQIRNKLIKKYYLVLVYGIWNNIYNNIKFFLNEKKINNKKYIYIDNNGKISYTKFSLIHQYKNFSLLEAKLKTGRMHQIRVHLSSIGYPIIGDNKYGNNILNNYFKKKKLKKIKFKRMFLHSYKIKFIHPKTKKNFFLTSKLPSICLNLLKNINKI